MNLKDKVVNFGKQSAFDVIDGLCEGFGFDAVKGAVDEIEKRVNKTAQHGVQSDGGVRCPRCDVELNNWYCSKCNINYTPNR